MCMKLLPQAFSLGANDIRVGNPAEVFIPALAVDVDAFRHACPAADSRGREDTG